FPTAGQTAVYPDGGAYVGRSQEYRRACARGTPTVLASLGGRGGAPSRGGHSMLRDGATAGEARASRPSTAAGPCGDFCAASALRAIRVDGVGSWLIRMRFGPGRYSESARSVGWRGA